MKITFILVRPVVPENIGFVCRAINNMGFTSLRVVGSDKHTRKGARNTAYETHHILESAGAFSTLEEAVADLDIVIGTTAKERHLRYEYVPSTEISNFLNERAGLLEHVGMVFGSESDGLHEHEEKLCDVLTTIPMAQEYPSINLSHSVMIYAYELFREGGKEVSAVEEREKGIYKAFREQVNEFLERMDVRRKQPGLYQHSRDRLHQMGPKDVRLFMSLARYLRKYLPKD